MAESKQPGYVKSETVIWLVVASLLVGFVGGVAFGIYKSGTVRGLQPTSAEDSQRKAAIEALQARIRQDSQDLDAWIQLGHHYFDAGLTKNAVDAYEKALAIDPNDANIWTDLGVMYRRNGDPRKAVEAFDKAIAVDPAHEISRFNKGIVLFHDLQDEDGALKAWESLLAINPDAKTPGGQTVRELVDHIKSNHGKNK